MESHTGNAIIRAAGALDEAATDVDLAHHPSPGGSVWCPTNPPGVRAVLRRRLLDESLNPDIRDQASGWLRKEAADVRSHARELVAEMVDKGVEPGLPDDPAMTSEPDGRPRED